MLRPEGVEDESETWDSELTLLVATIGYAVGLGNIWRVP
jgi:solute carrier family 6 amino acid/orphan transporter-like 15/16/17/18/20